MNRKLKGDIAASKALAAFIENNFSVFLPFANQPKYDFVVEKDSNLFKVQVKFAKSQGEYIDASLKSVWTDTKVTHIRNRQKGDYDVLCIYCPETDKCYYILDSEFVSNTAIRLRLTNTRKVNIRTKFASNFIDIDRIWKVIQRGVVAPC